MIEYKIKYASDKFDIDKYRESTELGYFPAQYQLGQCYEEDICVERNLTKAFKLYWQASDNCHPAQERLNKDIYQCQFAKWLKKAVNRKDFSSTDLTEVMCMLGSCYHHGYGVDCNMATAIEWWRKAAEKGGGMPTAFRILLQNQTRGLAEGCGTSLCSLPESC